MGDQEFETRQSIHVKKRGVVEKRSKQYLLLLGRLLLQEQCANETHSVPQVVADVILAQIQYVPAQRQQGRVIRSSFRAVGVTNDK